MGLKLKKIKIELSFAAFGVALAVVLYAVLPKQYETPGELKVAYIDRAPLVEFVELSQFLTKLPEKLNGVDVKFFRLEQFKYLVKLRSQSVERLRLAQNEVESAVDQAFKTKFESEVGKRKSELTDLNEQLRTLETTVAEIERTGSKTLADKFYLLQFKKMMAEFVSRKNLLESKLGEDATRYFEFSVSPETAGKLIFPRLAPLVFFSLFAFLALAYLVKRIALGASEG